MTVPPITGTTGLPKRPTGVFRFWFCTGVVIVLIFLLVAGLWILPRVQGNLVPSDVEVYTVRPGPLQKTIQVRGDLEAAESSEIVCRVRSLWHGSIYATTIKEIVPDGSHVQRGQVLVRLDDSEYVENLQTRAAPLEMARVNWLLAEENYKILKSQNESDLLTAEAAGQLAQLDLDKYLHGDSEQTRRDLQGRQKLAHSQWTLWQDRVAWAERMLQGAYITSVQERSEQAHFQNAGFALSKILEEARVFYRFGHLRTRTDLEAKLAQAKDSLERIKKQARAKEAQANADRLSKERIYTWRRNRFHEIEEEVRKCVLRAPHDGLVVYSMSGQARSGHGAQQGLIAQGEPVREGQVLMHLPDFSRMVIRVRIHEALSSRVQADRWEPTGFSEVLEAAMFAGPGTTTRLVISGAFEEMRQHFRDREMRKIESGLPALIRVVAFPERPLRGHVLEVSPVVSKADFWTSDVNMYQARIAIDDSLDGLKQDMSAEVTIFEPGAYDQALTVPVSAIINRPGEDNPFHCYVLTTEGLQVREVQLGRHNDEMVEVEWGLCEGDQVVLNPKRLEKSFESND